MNLNLDGKVAIVTGAAQGLGKVMAIALAEAGARVAFTDIDGGAVQKAAAETGRGAIAVAADINKLEDCERLVNETRAKLCGLHILVNAARRPHRGPGLPVGGNSLPFWESDPKIWQETVQTNIVGTFFLTRTVTPHLLAQNWGRIITITTSNAGFTGARGSPYGVTKAALESASLVFAADLAGTGVTANTLLPGGSCANDPGKVTKSGKPLLPMDVMNPALLWLASAQSDGVSGRRYIGKLWDNSLPLGEAAARAEEAPALPRKD